MGKPIPMTIADIAFPSRGAASAHCSKILNAGPINSSVTGDDHRFVNELWLNRPDKLAEFRGKRVVRFERRYREGKEKWTRCFWAIFEDGSATDFSFGKALDNIAAQQNPKPPDAE